MDGSLRPIIGIAVQTLEAVPGRLPACWVMGQAYVRVLAAAGAVPWLLPLLPDDETTLRLMYARLDAVFFTGGVDVDPSSYGEERHELCDRSDSARDWTEIRLVRWALADGKPLLGVCRGMQLINVACGGSLYQHLPNQLPNAIKHDCFPAATHFTRDHLAHSVRVDPSSRLGKVLGAPEVQVNSMHHQGIKCLSLELRPTAHAPDGLIEGVEGCNGQYLIGVQWHPEELVESHPSMRQLFTNFIGAAGAFRSR
jgi:putative glutamine amidotransferase